MENQLNQQINAEDSHCSINIQVQGPDGEGLSAISTSYINPSYLDVSSHTSPIGYGTNLWQLEPGTSHPPLPASMTRLERSKTVHYSYPPAANDLHRLPVHDRDRPHVGRSRSSPPARLSIPTSPVQNPGWHGETYTPSSPSMIPSFGTDMIPNFNPSYDNNGISNYKVEDINSPIPGLNSPSAVSLLQASYDQVALQKFSLLSPHVYDSSNDASSSSSYADDDRLSIISGFSESYDPLSTEHVHNIGGDYLTGPSRPVSVGVEAHMSRLSVNHSPLGFGGSAGQVFSPRDPSTIKPEDGAIFNFDDASAPWASYLNVPEGAAVTGAGLHLESCKTVHIPEATSSTSPVADMGEDTPGYRSNVASPAIIKASFARRKKPGRHKCTYCGSDFTAKHNLQNHLKSHMGIRDYGCKKCDRHFGTQHVLLRHEKTCGGKKTSP